MNQPTEERFSSEVQDILDKPPHNLLTYGMGAILAGVLVLIFVSLFFTYPDVVKGDLVLTTSVPPVPVVAQNTGYLAQIRVVENMLVKKDSILAVFSTKAKVDDVLKLETEMERLSQFDIASLKSYTPDWNLQLGEISESYASFINVFQYLSFDENTQTDEVAISGTNDYVRKIQGEISALKKSRSRKLEEREDAQQEVRERNSILSKKSSDENGRALIAANMKLQNLDKEIAGIDAKLEDRNDDLLNGNAKMLELQMTHQSGTKEKILQLKQDFSNLKLDIRRWKEQYLIIAPTDGKVSFFKDLSEKQFKKVGDELMVITPESTDNQFIGQVKLPAKGSGKVKEDDPVKIKFDRFPDRDFGYVTGRVSKIYALPVGDAYFVEVALNKGLTTHTGKELKFEQQLSAKAEITTADRKLFSRIFDTLLN